MSDKKKTLAEEALEAGRGVGTEDEKRFFDRVTSTSHGMILPWSVEDEALLAGLKWARRIPWKDDGLVR